MKEQHKKRETSEQNVQNKKNSNHVEAVLRLTKQYPPSNNTAAKCLERVYAAVLQPPKQAHLQRILCVQHHRRRWRYPKKEKSTKLTRKNHRFRCTCSNTSLAAASVAVNDPLAIAEKVVLP
jgi:hypothetical protein